MNQAETQYQEILHTLDKILANLGLMLEDYDVEYLTQADLYIEIFKVMFPVLEPVLSGGFGEDVTDEEIIQYLVNILAKDIIKMDLDHIKGELIVQGDAKNILNFLQLLYEISKMVVDKEDKRSGKRSKRKRNEKLVKSSAQSANQSRNQSQDNSVEWKQKYNSVIGINAEFSNGSASQSVSEARQSEDNSYGEDYENLLDERALLAQRLKENVMADPQMQGKTVKTDPRMESHSVSRISEVSKSKESSEYDKRPKKYSGISQKIEDFNPAVLHRKSLGADPKYGSYNSDDMRALRGVDEEEEEEVEVIEDREGHPEEGTEREYDAEHEPGYTPESMNGHEEHEDIEGQEEYMRQVNGEGDFIEEHEDDYPEHEMRKISTEQVEEDDVEYYAHDPINYQPMSKGVQRMSQEPERDEEKDEDIEHVDRMHEDVQNDEYDEEEHDQEEHQEQDDIEHTEEVEDYGENSEELREQKQEEEGHSYREEMQEVAEEYDEEAQHREESYTDERNEAQYPPGPYTYIDKGKKEKGKVKGKTTGKKKTSKTGKGKIEQRALKPETPGMKVEKQNKNKTSGRISAKKSKVSPKHKKLAHSKSERNLNAPDDQEEAHSQSGAQYEEEYSEERGLEPKEYEQNQEGSESHSQREQSEQQSEVQEEQEYAEDTQSGVPDGNVFKILSDNVMRVKENLRENKEIQDIAFDDEKTVKVIMQQKNQYKQYLNDFMKDHQIRERKYINLKELSQKNFEKKMKSERIRDENLKKEFANQQKSLYLKMRDEKVNFLRKTHKTIFELEKKRIIEDKKEYVEFRKTKNNETRNMIDSIKNEYKNKVELLKEKTRNEHHERKIASEAQRSFMKTIEHELKGDQVREAERMKDKLRHEKERFEMMMKDEGFLTQKVMQLYKKGAF